MWDTPSWLGTAIRAKVDANIASENRASNEAIAAANRSSTESIAEANRQSNEAIAAANRASSEAIAEANREINKQISDLDRASQETIATARNEVTAYGIDVGASTAAAQRMLEREMTNIRIASNERIAANELTSREGISQADRESRERINRENITANLYIDSKKRELTASEGAKSRELTASEGDKNRQTQMDVAKLNVAQRVVSEGVRLVPYMIGSSDFTFKGGGSGGTLNTSPNVSSTTDSAKSKADALFPDVSPTFSSELPTVSKNSGLAAVGALLVSAFSGMASFVPFI